MPVDISCSLTLDCKLTAPCGLVLVEYHDGDSKRVARIALKWMGLHRYMVEAARNVNGLGQQGQLSDANVRGFIRFASALSYS